MARTHKTRCRIDQLLVDRGLCDDLRQAQAMIMAGQVIVDDVREDKAGTQVQADCRIRLRGCDIPYVSRGGLKLKEAIDAWGIDVSGKVAIDAGACTGGFTHCLLSQGCALVYAVEVGFGQLAGSLRQNPRVRNMERTNISDVRPDQLDPQPVLGVMDLSYLSLSVAVPVVSRLLKRDEPDRQVIALVKPLFEVPAPGPELARAQYRAALERACASGTPESMAVNGLMASPVLGSSGTLEFLASFRPGPEVRDLDAMIEKALDDGERILRDDHIRRSQGVIDSER